MQSVLIKHDVFNIGMVKWLNHLLSSHQSLKSDLSLSKPITCFSPKPLSMRLNKPPNVTLFEDDVILRRSQSAKRSAKQYPEHQHSLLPNPNNQMCFHPVKLWACLPAISLVWTNSISVALWFLFSFLLTDLLIRVVCIINQQWLASRLKYRTPVSPHELPHLKP